MPINSLPPTTIGASWNKTRVSPLFCAFQKEAATDVDLKGLAATGAHSMQWCDLSLGGDMQIENLAKMESVALMPEVTLLLHGGSRVFHLCQSQMHGPWARECR
jgi:hypothetical protein